MILENISDNHNPLFLYNSNSSITTIVSDKNNNLVIGDYQGNAVHFKRTENNWRLIRNFENLGLGWITAGCVQGDIAVLGGNNSFIKFVDLQNGTLFNFSIATSLMYIYSMQIYFVNGAVLMSVFGDKSNYCKLKTDFFDLTEYYKNGDYRVFGDDFQKSFKAVMEINNKEFNEIKKHNQDLQLLIEQMTGQHNRILAKKNEEIRKLKEKPFELRQKEFEFENELENVANISIEYPNQNKEILNPENLEIEKPKNELQKASSFGDLQQQMMKFTVEKEQLAKEKQVLTETVDQKETEIENLQNLLKKMSINRVEEIKKEREQEHEDESDIKHLTKQLQKRDDFLGEGEKNGKMIPEFGTSANGYCSHCNNTSEFGIKKPSFKIIGNKSQNKNMNFPKKTNISNRKLIRKRVCKRWWV